MCRYIVARNVAEAADKAAAQYGPGKVLVQEPDVLDTWFSSGLWPFSTLGWPNTDAQDYKTFYPTQVHTPGQGQGRGGEGQGTAFWVACVMAKGDALYMSRARTLLC